jgi:SAM-dependent methyltransferase
MTAIAPLGPKSDDPWSSPMPQEDIQILDLEGQSMEGWAPLNIPGIKSNMLLQALGNATETLDVGYHVAKAQYLMEKQLQKEKMVEETRTPTKFVGALGELVQQDLENIANGIYKAPYNAKHHHDNPDFVFEHITNLMKSASQDPHPQAMPHEDPRNEIMQRQALVPLSNYISARVEEETKLLEVACGHGRLHILIKDNWPKMHTTCSDLSMHNVAETKDKIDSFIQYQKLTRGRDVSEPEYVVAPAEALPFEDEEFHCLVNTFLFHGLPKELQEMVATEFYRVMKPGGQLVFVDLVQQHTLDSVTEDQGCGPADPVEIFENVGFKFESSKLALNSKVLSFRKPNIHGALVGFDGLPERSTALSLPKPPSSPGPGGSPVAPSGPVSGL